MSEAWRNTYDGWKLQPPPWLEDEEDEEDEEERLDAETRAEHLAEAQYMEDHFERKYRDAR